MIDKLQQTQARDGFSGAWTLGDKMSDGAFGAVFRATPASGAGDGLESKPDTVPRSYAVKRFPKEGKDELFAQQVVNEVGGGGVRRLVLSCGASSLMGVALAS